MVVGWCGCVGDIGYFSGEVVDAVRCLAFPLLRSWERLRLRRLQLHGGVEKDSPFRRSLFRSCFRLFVAALVLVVA